MRKKRPGEASPGFVPKPPKVRLQGEHERKGLVEGIEARLTAFKNQGRLSAGDVVEIRGLLERLRSTNLGKFQRKELEHMIALTKTLGFNTVVLERDILSTTCNFKFHEVHDKP